MGFLLEDIILRTFSLGKVNLCLFLVQNLIAFFTKEKSEIKHLKKYLSSLDHKNLNLDVP